MPDSDSKLPVSIVNTIINKLTAFTQEIEILRGQLPARDHLYSKLDRVEKNLGDILGEVQTSINRTFITIKVVFALITMVITLSFLGARVMNWYQDRQKAVPVVEEIKKEIREERNEDLQKVLDELHALKEQLKEHDDERQSNTLDEPKK